MSFLMAHARTNLFKIKNEDAFRRWAEACGFEVYTRDGFFGLRLEPEDGWVHVNYPAAEFLVDGQDVDETGDGDGDEDEGEHGDDDFELADELAHFLQSGSIAIYYRAGGDSHGDVFGDAVAVNSDGKSVEVSISDIVKKAKTELGGEVKDWG